VTLQHWIKPVKIVALRLGILGPFNLHSFGSLGMVRDLKFIAHITCNLCWHNLVSWQPPLQRSAMSKGFLALHWILKWHAWCVCPMHICILKILCLTWCMFPLSCMQRKCKASKMAVATRPVPVEDGSSGLRPWSLSAVLQPGYCPLGSTHDLLCLKVKFSYLVFMSRGSK